jgi:hypothetical protein
MTLDEWQAGWDALAAEAKRRGSCDTPVTTTVHLPTDLWDRIVSYPPKPTSHRSPPHPSPCIDAE